MTGASPIALVVVADEPALFFDSVASAALNLEAIDVRDGVYGPIYGPRGELYDAFVVEERVVIIANPFERPDPDGLRQVLIDFLRRVSPGIPQAEDLEGLLRQCAPYVEGVSGNRGSVT
jgi:hypothetical protein